MDRRLLFAPHGDRVWNGGTLSRAETAVDLQQPPHLSIPSSYPEQPSMVGSST